MQRSISLALVLPWACLSLAFACGDNKQPLTDAGVAGDARPGADADPNELLVLSTLPTDNAIEADRSSKVTLIFDRPIDTSSIDSTSLWAFGQWSGAHKGTYLFSEGDTQVVIDSPRNLIPGEVVMVVVANRVMGASGSMMRPGGYSYQFRVGSTPASMNFIEIANISSRNLKNEPGQSYGGVAADLDLDGYPDITIINEKSEDLVVFMNRADGTGMLDRGPTEHRVGIRPSPSESADFDGDGETDLCVANIGSGVSVLLGLGNGSFKPETEYTTGMGPRGIAVLDADGDGDPDIVNANYRSNDLSLLINKGDGRFESAVHFDGGCNGEWAVAAADMNSDHILDLVVGCHDDGVISVLTGDGVGGFQLRSTRQGPEGLWMLALGDLSGDATVDVTVAGGFSDNGAVLLGDGLGNLGAAELYGTDPSTSATDIGDLDGDGDLDWITSSFGGDDSDWYFWRNDGTGTFTKLLEWDSPQSASCALLLDLDLDGDLDIGLIDETKDRLILLENN